MKSISEGINSRLNGEEERISELEDRVMEIIATEQKKEKRMKRNEDSLIDLWDSIKDVNIHITVVPEGEERESVQPDNENTLIKKTLETNDN